MASSSLDTPNFEETVEYLYTSNLEETDLLDGILSCKQIMVSVLSGNTTSTKVISNLVHILARAVRCRSKADRPKVYDMLTLTVDSPLLGLKGVQILTEQGEMYSHELSCILKDFLELLQCTSTYMPTSLVTTQKIGFVDFLKETITNEEGLEKKQVLMDRVFEIKNSIIANISKRVKANNDNKVNREDNMKPPESFREMSIMPEESDLLYQTTFLRRNKAHGKYNDLDHYLDVQFRLYREDCIAPLREVFEDFHAKNGHNKHFRLKNGRIYRDIQISKGTSTSLEHGEVFVVELDRSHCKRIHWNNSKRLIFGSLLLLSFDNFKSTLFAVVSEADRNTLKEFGQFKVRIFRNSPNQQIPRDTKGIILEATSAYFESYYHVLNAMQAIQEDTFPFQKYIVHCHITIDAPKYLTEVPGTMFDLGPVLLNSPIEFNSNDNGINVRNHEKGLIEHMVKVGEETNWPSDELLNLDESQRQAFITALTKEFVLIQGPPGTGKTHLGLQIAKVLLHNRNEWGRVDKEATKRKKPCLLVVCFTNHALDQFVEGIIDFLPQGKSSYDLCEEIVRIGSQCKNEKVDKFSIRNLRQTHLLDSKTHILRQAEKCKHLVHVLRESLKAVRRQTVVLKYGQVEHFIDSQQRFCFGGSPTDAWLDWLHISPKTWFEEVKKRYKNTHYKKRKSAIRLPQNDQDFIDVVEEADYAYTERSLDEDAEYSFDVNLIAVNIPIQLKNMLQETTNKRRRTILQEETESVLSELSSSVIADENLIAYTGDVWEIPLVDRWKMYRFWLKQYLEKTKERLHEAEEQFSTIFRDYRNARLEVDEDIMKGASVVAMTTTGAAKYHELLHKLSPQITIIEEAAEVPEAHIVTAINPQCEHVILIGDHKQLEPKPAVRELAIKYNLSISLFERMLNNGLHYHCLERQHRMRPEISNLVRHMYPVLEDNENVLQYENIKGIRHNLFFVDHNHEEQYNDDGKSFSNEFEANFMSQLCEYLLKQGYKGSEITILAAYSGQMFCIRGKMPKPRFEGVNVSVLDNYQGEENEIILLSLVRSNDNGDIGFLTRENRICVALSRAKKGLYMIGNSSTFTSKSKHWNLIINRIKGEREQTFDNSEEKFRLFGNSLPLYCQNHPDENGIHASEPDDFSKSPDGGCLKPCEARLDCGHACRYKCHPVDPNHERYVCMKFCMRSCKNGHFCRKQCHFPNRCDCSIIVRQILNCGHTMNLRCYEDPEESLCQADMNRKLNCGHEVILKCHVNQENYLCNERVTNTRKDCGHEFTRYCHDNCFERTRECAVEIEKTCQTCGQRSLKACFIDLNSCEKGVQKKLECGHIITVKCYQNRRNDFRCSEKCDKTCEYGHLCNKMCHFPEPCKLCEFMMEKTVPKCGHKIAMPCYKDVDKFDNCSGLVEMIRNSCGHQMTVQCFKKSSIKNSLQRHALEKEVKCEYLVEFEVPLCKHIDKIPCWKQSRNPSSTNRSMSYSGACTQASINCVKEESVKLSCGHIQTVECWKIVRAQGGKFFPNQTKFHVGIKCNVPVTTKLECGHSTDIECWQLEDIKAHNFRCKENVDVELELCGHTLATECYKKSSIVRTTHLRNICEKEITYIHPDCYHETQIKCKDNPDFVNKMRDMRYNSSQNNIPVCSVTVERTLDCGHLILAPCIIKQEVLLCDKRCSQVLFCGHCCYDMCKNCQIRGTHNTCTLLCNKTMFCGHSCEGYECFECTVCCKQCNFSCEHSVCTLPCRELCKPCEV